MQKVSQKSFDVQMVLQDLFWSLHRIFIHLNSHFEGKKGDLLSERNTAQNWPEITFFPVQMENVTKATEKCFDP